MDTTNTGWHNLADAWKSAVEEGKINNEFQAAVSDPGHRWKTGDRLRFGLRLHNGQPGYFAINMNTGLPIQMHVEERYVSGTNFACQFNEYRGLRPGGAQFPVGRQPDISAAPSDCRFYCQSPDKPLSIRKRHPLAQVKLQHRVWNVYYNAFPFDAAGHFLCVPCFVRGTDFVLEHLPQRLSLNSIEDLLLLNRDEPPLMFFFSSLHAGASVNHIHIQAVFHRKRLPIEDAQRASYKSITCLTNYIAEAFVFSGCLSATLVHRCVERLQERGVPFNLLLVRGEVFVFPRNPEHEVVEEFPGGVLAATDLAGKIITTDRRSYENADKARVQNAFFKTCVSVRKLIDEW